MQWYLKVLTQYADFDGRARRTEFWMFTLVSAVISIVLSLVDGALGTNGAGFGLLGGLYSLAVLIPSLAVSVRRLHDTDRSGWWVLIGLVPLVGAIVLIVFFATDGSPVVNAHGPNPKQFAGGEEPRVA